MTAPQHEHQQAGKKTPMSKPDTEENQPPPPRWTGPQHGWFSYRYPHTNGAPHSIKKLRYPPNGNVDEWVDNGPEGAN